MATAPLTTAQQLQQLQTQLQALANLEASDVSALSARVTHIESDLSLTPPPAPIPAPAPAPIPTPAPIAPIFLTPGGGSWTDSSGAVWAIDSGANILMNGNAGAAKNWQSHLGAGFNGTFYVLGLDMNVYAWQNPWQLVPYVAATNPIPAPAPPPPPPPGTLIAFYVNPTTGNDGNAGTRNSPFLTLEKAQSAMQGSKTKTTVLMAGVFNRNGASFTLGGADAGTTWRFDPATGTNADYNQAIIDGGGVGNIINVFGSNITWNGIQLRNSTNSGFEIDGHNHNGGTTVDSVTIQNCEIHNITNTDGAPVAIWGATNTLVDHNYIHDVNSKGIGVETWSTAQGIGSNDDSSGTTITNNVILNSNTTNNDNGAIYMQDLTGNGTTKNVTIKNNFIRDYGNQARFTKGIYFDDGASNATVTGNIIAGLGQYAFQYHGGDNNVVSGNILDLGANGNQYIMFYQNSPTATVNNMSGNTFTGNIVIAGTLTPNSYNTNISGQTLPNVTNNVYHGYNGAGTNTSGGGITDSNAVLEDPQLSGWPYTVAAGSPVFNSPVNFPGITGGYGPPGFVLPQTGTAPTSPH